MVPPYSPSRMLHTVDDPVEEVKEMVAPGATVEVAGVTCTAPDVTIAWEKDSVFY